MRARALLLSAVLGTVTFGLLAQPSAAMTTFSGSCESRAFINSFPGRTLVPIPSGYAIHGVGHCKGLLNGAPFDGPVKMDIYADMKTLMSCEYGYSTDGGPMYWTFLTGGSNAGIPASAHSPPDPPAGSPSGSRAGMRAVAHASRKKGHRRRHHKRKRHRASASPTTTAAPAPAPPRENPVLTTWVTEAHAGGTIVNNYFGAYRGWATGTNQYEADFDTLKQCSSREGNTGIWIDGNMHTITELQG